MTSPRETSTPAAGPSLAYGVLTTKSAEYDPEAWACLDAFYRGGFELEKRAKEYLPQLLGEHAKRYQDRCKAAGYINHLGHIVDKFTGAVFAKEFSLGEAADAKNKATAGGEAPEDFKEFFADADGKGTPFRKLLSDTLTSALLKRRALLAIDLPPAAPGLASRAEEEALGLGRPLAYALPLEQLIDYERDDDGGFSWAVIHRLYDRKGPPGARLPGNRVEEFKIWEKIEPGEDPREDAAPANADIRADEASAPTVRWTLYRIEYDPNEPPQPDTMVDMAGAGETSFRRIPILEFELDAGLWIGNKIGTLCREHWQRRTSLNAAQNKSLVAVPYAKLGPEIPAQYGAISEAQSDPNRGRDIIGQFEAQGYVVVGKDDELGYLEPEGKCYELVDKELDGLKDEIYRVVDQMAESASNNASATRRSGESKKQDKTAFHVTCASYAEEVRAFAVLAATALSDARGEDVVWTAHGLDGYGDSDRQTLLAEAVSIDEVPIPSITFKKLHKQDIAMKLLPTAPAETKEQIRDEIEKGVKEEEAAKVEARRVVAVKPQNKLVGKLAPEGEGAAGGEKPRPE